MSLETEAAAGVRSEVSRVPPDFALRIIDAFAEAALVAALLGELGVVLANVLARISFHRSFLWVDEVSRLALSTLAFVGGAVAYRRRDHAFVRVVVNLFSERVQRVCLVLADILAMFTAGVAGVASIEFVASSWNERTPILQVPAATIALPLAAGMALLVFYAVEHLGDLEHSHQSLPLGHAGAVPGLLSVGPLSDLLPRREPSASASSTRPPTLAPPRPSEPAPPPSRPSIEPLREPRSPSPFALLTRGFMLVVYCCPIALGAILFVLIPGSSHFFCGRQL